MENISVYVAGSNLLEFAKNKEERQLTIGSRAYVPVFLHRSRASF